jgi:hypothetical protein
VQRRIEQTNRRRQPIHRFEQFDEILPLQWQQRGERIVTLLIGVRENDTLDEHPTIAKEHVLGAGQANTFCTKVPGADGIFSVVSICPHSKSTGAVGVTQQPIN